MAIQPAGAQYEWSCVRNDRVEVSRLYEDGFLFLQGDPLLWIQRDLAGLLSVRSLELDLWGYGDDRIGDSIGELSQLSHLCISNGYFLKCLPNTISRLQNLHHLEVRFCWKLQELPANLGDCRNLTSLTLLYCYLLKSLPNSVAKLSNLTTLSICYCGQLQELPAKFGGLQSLASLTFRSLGKSLPNWIANMSKLTTLNLSECINLEELPANLGDLELLTTLFLNGCDCLSTLPWSIVKLSKLQFLYLPSSVRLETLPPNMNDDIIISVQNTHASKTWKELKTEIQFPIFLASHFSGRKDPISNNDYHAFSSSLNYEMELTPTGNKDGILPFVNECLLDIPGSTWQVLAPMEIEGYHIHGGNNPVSENNSHVTSSLQNQEPQIGTSNSRDRGGVVTSVSDIAAVPSFNVNEFISCGENSQEAFQNGRMNIMNLESEQGIAPCDTLNVAHGESNHFASENKQDNNTQSDYVKHNTQKKEVPLERIRELMSQNMRLEDARKHLDVSRSTLKRALKKLNLTWPSSRKWKYRHKNHNETNDANSSARRILSQLNSVNPADPAGLGQGAMQFDRPNQRTMSVHVQSELNVVNESNSDAVIRTVEEPPMSTQCRMDGNQQFVEHVNGAKECALANTDVHLNESCSTFDVKATYNEEKARFYFSLSSSIEQLMEELGKRLDLEVGKFKMYYQDDEKEWIVLACISDLERALLFSKSSGSNIVRLWIKLRN